MFDGVLNVQSAMLQVMCNNPEVQTSSPHPETPGSGLECNYGWYGEHGPNPGQNLTTQVQGKKYSWQRDSANFYNNIRKRLLLD